MICFDFGWFLDNFSWRNPININTNWEPTKQNKTRARQFFWREAREAEIPRIFLTGLILMCCSIRIRWGEKVRFFLYIQQRSHRTLCCCDSTMKAMDVFYKQTINQNRPLRLGFWLHQTHADQKVQKKFNSNVLFSILEFWIFSGLEELMKIFFFRVVKTWKVNPLEFYPDTWKDYNGFWAWTPTH